MQEWSISWSNESGWHPNYCSHEHHGGGAFTIHARRCAHELQCNRQFLAMVAQMKNLNCAAQISYLAQNPCHASDPTCLCFNLDFNLVKDGLGHCIKLMHIVIHHNPGVTKLILHTPFDLCHQTLHQDSRCQQQHKSLIAAHNLWLNSRTCFVMRSLISLLPWCLKSQSIAIWFKIHCLNHMLWLM